MIELPLKYPEVFERLGIDAPKGVLLHGPPGCGKTLIARAVANETSAHFIHISGPEVIHKFYGESEAHLRALFEDARTNAPSIVFVDEIDAIASKREEIRGDQQVERRVVAQLLALMDGLKSRGEVVVIGATNIPNVLDPALRRPGRFDREIAISIPDKNARLEILHIHIRGMPLADDVDLERIAGITHGFVGADLEALAREAAMITLRKIMPKIEFEADNIPYELLLELEVTMDDFLNALKEVEPSAIREVFIEIPDVRWDDVGGLDEVKRVLKESIEWPLKYPELFDHMRTNPPKGILLYGPPGSGKTFLAKAVASESEINFISVKGPELLSKWVGESERGIREVFRKAKQASPCIVFFDEIDAIAPIRGASSDSHVTERVISQFLTELDGMEELKGVIVLAATNRLDMVDPALLRPGRFDLRLELPTPDAKARLEIFNIHTRGKPLAADVDLKALADTTDGLVGADIEAICRRASMLAIREFLGKHRTFKSETKKVDLSQAKVSNKHFEEVIRELRKK
jgi:transitional endoplasmic reticulum ATPase